MKLSFRFRDILTSYAKGWLWIDAVSVVPWEILLQASFASSSSMDVASAPRLLKLFRLARLLKLLRVLRLRKVRALCVATPNPFPPPSFSLGPSIPAPPLVARRKPCEQRRDLGGAVPSTDRSILSGSSLRASPPPLFAERLAGVWSS